MLRLIAFSLEPSDALAGLLRLRAAAEAGRWPTDVSGRFRAAIDREFDRLEACVRAVGVCYSELEERGVAAIDRVPQSRFSDVDGALHLAACTTEVAIDLDHVRVAVDRGERAVRDSGVRLATALRHLLWYAVHSDLLVCPRFLLNDAEVSPERGLDLVDAYLASAWRGLDPPQPPAPPREARISDRHERLDAVPAEATALPFRESTAMFPHPVGDAHVDLLGDTGEALTAFGDERTRPGQSLDPEVRALLATAHTSVAPPADFFEEVPVVAVRRRPVVESARESYPSQVYDELTEDGAYFIEETGIPWPCTQEELRAAGTSLAMGASAGDPRSLRARNERLERGFSELWRRLSR